MTTEAVEAVAAIRFQPIDDRVLILPDEPVETSRGGIIIPDSAKGRAEHGTVLAVGPGDWNKDGTGRIPMTIQVGDRVAFGRYAGTEFTIDRQECFIMREAEVFGVLPQAD